MADSESDDSGFVDELVMTSTQTARTGSAGAGAPAAVVAGGLADEVCAAWYDIKVCPGVVTSLGTPRSAERPDHICTTPSRVMEPSKGWTDR